MKFHEYFVYILKCSNQTYYTGVTSNLTQRVQQHQAAVDPKAFTARFAPCELVFYTSFNNIEYAIEKEKQIKKWSKAKKEALIRGEYEALPNLSKKKFT